LYNAGPISGTQFRTHFLVPLSGKFQYPKNLKKVNKKGSAILEGMADYLLSQRKKVAEPVIGFTWVHAKQRITQGILLGTLKLRTPF